MTAPTAAPATATPTPTAAADHRSAPATLLTSSPPAQFPTVNPTNASFAGTLAQHAMAWHRPAWTETQIAHDITSVAVALIPAARGAAILTMTAPGEVTVSAAHGIVPDLSRAAHAAAGRANTIADLPSANGWPVFTTPAGPGWPGITICAPLGSAHTMFGTLIIAADDHPGAAASTTAMLTVLAMHASIALSALRERTNLLIGLASRDVIGQAKGILMERRRITADAAFTELTRLSQTGNLKLRDLCEQVTASGEIPELPANTGRTSRATQPTQAHDSPETSPQLHRVPRRHVEQAGPSS